MKLISTLFLFLLLTIITNAQQTDCLLYNSKGELLAAPELKLNSQQLQKWLGVESQILPAILDSLVYPPMARDAGMSMNLIVAFSINEEGSSDNFEILIPENPSKAIISFKESISFSVQKNAAYFLQSGLRADTPKTEKYYLAVKFQIWDKEEKRSIENGYLIYAVKEIPLNSKDILWSGGCGGAPAEKDTNKKRKSKK
jgi:hypothetical protein